MPNVVDERRPDIGIKASLGKVGTAGILGTAANLITLYFGRMVIGDAITDPVYYSLASAAVLAVLLNVKLYGMVILRYFVQRWMPRELWEQLTATRAAERDDPDAVRPANGT